MNDWIKRKFWKKVIDALDELQDIRPCNQISLVLNENVSINLDMSGGGFVLNSRHPLYNSPVSLKIYQPREVQEKIRNMYNCKEAKEPEILFI